MTTVTLQHQAATQELSLIKMMNLTIQSWLDRSAQRKQLLTLTDTQLNDIGLTYKLAVIEASKPFWK